MSKNAYCHAKAIPRRDRIPHSFVTDTDSTVSCTVVQHVSAWECSNTCVQISLSIPSHMKLYTAVRPVNLQGDREVQGARKGLEEEKKTFEEE